MHFVWPKTKNSADTICRTMSLADGWPSRQVHSMWRVRIGDVSIFAKARKKEFTAGGEGREQGRGRASAPSQNETGESEETEDGAAEKATRSGTTARLAHRYTTGAA